MLRYLFAGLLAFIGLTFTAGAKAATTDSKSVKTVKLFNIGNSFSQNATLYLKDIVAAAGHKLVHRAGVIGGSSMQVHWDKAQLHEREPDNKAGLYSTGKGLKEELAGEKWDYVTIQQASIKSHDIKNYRPYARQLYDYIKQHAPDAEVILHETWEYRVDDPRFSVKDPLPGEPKTKDEMYRGLSSSYREIASELGVRIIPTGDAFHIADNDPRWAYQVDKMFDFKAAKQPALPDQTHSLHVGWRWSKPKDSTAPAQLKTDGHHANTAGCYLGACVFFETLYKESVVGNKFVPKGVDAEFARYLQETAHQAVAAVK